MGLDIPTVNWFRNYLNSRFQVVVADGFRSSSLTVCKGVPQGSILGPLLFTMYLNYLIALLEYCFIHFYADDAILCAVGSTLLIALENLQSAFNIFQRSLFSHKLVLNSSKTKCMLFSRSSKPDVIPCIVTFQKEQIEIVDTYKYLGFWLDSRLSFQTCG